MSKIKDCILHGCKELHDDLGGYPISIPGFLRSMAIVLIADADMRLRQDVPTVTIGGETVSGKAKNDPAFLDYVSVLNHDDFARGTGQSMQLMGFFNWFMEQDEPDDEEMLWYDPEFVLNKWNEYAKAQRSK